MSEATRRPLYARAVSNSLTTGVMLSPHVPLHEFVGLGQYAESLGYDRVWVPDEGLATRDVVVAMTALATATTRIAIGTGIVNPYTRHPALTAAAIASVDELSGGRAFLGIGVGGQLTLAPLGIERTLPVARLREAIEVSRHLFHGHADGFVGATASVHRGRLEYARADIEIWFAGRGDQTLRLGGELCDGVLLEFVYKPELHHYVSQVRTGAARSGRVPRLCYSTVVVPDRSYFDSIRPHMTYRIVDSPAAAKATLGITAEAVDEIRRAMAGGLDAAAPLIRDEWIEPFVLVGSEHDVRSELDTMVDEHGIGEFLLVLADMRTARDQLDYFAGVRDLGP